MLTSHKRGDPSGHNLYVPHVFTPLTSDTRNTNWFLYDFGLALTLTCVPRVWIAPRKRGELKL